MATVYVKDSVLIQYAAEFGGEEEAKKKIQEVVEENAPGDDDA